MYSADSLFVSIVTFTFVSVSVSFPSSTALLYHPFSPFAFTGSIVIFGIVNVLSTFVTFTHAFLILPLF